MNYYNEFDKDAAEFREQLFNALSPSPKNAERSREASQSKQTNENQ